MAESESDIRIATGELWGVCSGDFGENWPRYNGTALYACSNQQILYPHAHSTKTHLQENINWVGFYTIFVHSVMHYKDQYT